MLHKLYKALHLHIGQHSFTDILRDTDLVSYRDLEVVPGAIVDGAVDGQIEVASAEIQIKFWFTIGECDSQVI